MAYILVLDDDEDFASVVAQVLSDAGHEVQVQLETPAALKSIEKRPPDLLVLDVMFPEDSTAGFTFARTLYKQGRNIPILMLTAVNARFPLGFNTKDIDEDWMPVSDFLEKPVDLDILLERATALLKKNTKS